MIIEAKFNMKKIIAIILISISFCTVAAQTKDGSNIVITGQSSYGYDIEKLRPTQTSFGYMTYDLGLGFQAEPEDNDIYEAKFGFPILSVGVSVARMGHLKFSDHTKFPNLYTVYGSFERSLLRRERFSAGYLFDFGATYNPGRYDPVKNQETTG